MANIKQQRKRVKIAARERAENLRYKSRIKTMFRSLSVAVEEDKDRAAELGLQLTSLIDRAAARGVIHANNAAHKKARVAAMVELAEGSGLKKGPATLDAKSGVSKAARRDERNATKRTKKVAARASARARAAAAAEEEAPAAEEKAPAGEPAAEEAQAEAEAPAETEAEPVEEAADEPDAAEAPEAETAPAEEAAADAEPAEEAASEEAAADAEPAEEAAADAEPAAEAEAEGEEQ